MTKILDYIDPVQHASILDYTSEDDHRGALQWALNESQAVECPPGRYNIDTDGGAIQVPKGGRMIGGGGSPNWNHKTGAWIKISGNTNPCFAFKQEIAAENIGFDYPDQVDSTEPIVYPATFSGDPAADSAGAHFDRVVTTRGTSFYQILNAATGKGAGRAWFRDCKLHALANVIDIDLTTEIAEVTDCMFGGGVLGQLTSHQLPKLRTYTKENAASVRIGEGAVRMSGGITWGAKHALLCDLGHLEGGAHDMLIGQTINPVRFEDTGWPAHFVVSGATTTPFDLAAPSRETDGAASITSSSIGTPYIVIGNSTTRKGPMLGVYTQDAGGYYAVSNCAIQRRGNDDFVINDTTAQFSQSNCVVD